MLTPALMGFILLGLAAGVRVAAWPIARGQLPDRGAAPRPDVAPAPPLAGDSLAAVVVEHDPFRISRRPAPVAYDPLRVGAPAAPPTPKPALALVGIVWDGGRDPTALLEGVPGVDGPRVVRSGEAVGGLRVKRIARDRVVVVGLDTAWTLVVKEPWR